MRKDIKIESAQIIISFHSTPFFANICRVVYIFRFVLFSLIGVTNKRRNFSEINQGLSFVQYWKV
jgi:hypothetical protein